MGVLTRDKLLMLSGTATLAITLTAGAVADDRGSDKPKTPKMSPYVAGDMHNHNTCTDGSVSAAYTIDRAVGTGTFAPSAANGASPILPGGRNFDLDWFTLGNHGGSGNRDCRFADTSAILGETTTTWDQTLGRAINGDGVVNGPNSITIGSLLGTQPAGPPTSSSVMWRWQNIKDLEYPIVAQRGKQYKKVLIEGLEWIVPGHEHTDVTVINGQFPDRQKIGSAASLAEFEFRFDRADTDTIGPVDMSGNPVWTGKSVDADGIAGHRKAVAGIAWLQANYPVTSYAVPTHSERQGPFSATSSKGYDIEHFRDFNNAGPTVAFGIESPGHMAQVTSKGSTYGSGAVGGGTYGLAGIYTAKVGGLWDGMLAEGRNYFLFVSSDWHDRGTFGARDSASTSDFIPGEFSKLYVPNKPALRARDILDGMRSGNTFSVNGDLLGPEFTYRARVRGDWTTMGETLAVRPGDTVTVQMQMVVPARNNSPYSFNNPILETVGIKQPLNKPSLDHVDLITSPITGVVQPTDPNYAVPNAAGVAGAAIVYNSEAVIAQTINVGDMTVTPLSDGSTRLAFRTTFTAGNMPFYIRARGTNLPTSVPSVTDSAGNPLIDTGMTNITCADPACPAHLEVIDRTSRVSADVAGWSNLWFYANPIFIRPAGSPQLLVEKNAELAEKLTEKTEHSDDYASRKDN